MMEKYEKFKKHWRRRAEREIKRNLKLAIQAGEEAKKLSALLIREFGAKRVYLFGSLSREGAFYEGSDIDLAVEGIEPSQLLKAGAFLDRACEYRYLIDLIDLDAVSDGMKELILTYGVLLDERGED
jgi:predicted nucleotidyltransferase